MNQGFSSTSSGVVLSLAQLNEITLDKPRGTVTLGTGNRWGDVYRALAPHGFAVAGGRGSSVGVGGLSLGGGFSFFLYEHGFSCDNIVEYTVATAKGEVFSVTETAHPELFLALKGSGAPFVLVLSFTYKLILLEDPAGVVYGGAMMSGHKALPAVLDSVTAIASGNEDVKAHVLTLVFYTFGNDEKTVISTIPTNYVFYQRPLADTPAALQPLVDAHNFDLLHSTVGNRSIASITDEIVAQGEGMRQFMLQWTIVDPTTEVVAEMERITREEVAKTMLVVPEFVVVLTLVPIGAEAVRKGRNVLGLEKGRRYLSMSYNVVTGKVEDDEVILEAVRRGKRKCAEYLKKTGHWSPWT